MTWIDELLTAHAELESPEAFWYWSGLCAISAVVKDSVYLDRDAFKTYPNIYVMLHAASGLKKAPPVGLAKRLVKGVNNTRIISGRSSIQGILKELGTAHTIPGGKISNKSTGFIVASEFSSSLVADPAAMTILTDLYDRYINEGEWKSLLKMETFNLKDPTISLLVATNEAHFDDFLDVRDLHGGFIGRMFIIAETKVRRRNSLIAPMQTTPDIDSLIDYLKKISLLEGPFHPIGSRTEDDEYCYAKDTDFGTIYFNAIGSSYDSWYDTFYEQVSEQSVEDPTGTIQRFGDSVLKVAMLLSLSNSTDLIIHMPQMEEAIGVCEKLIGNIRKTTHGKKGLSQYAQHKALIITELMGRSDHRITRMVLAKKYWMHFNIDELDELMKSFEAAGMITASSQGNQVVYQMPKKQVEEMERFLAGKNK